MFDAESGKFVDANGNAERLYGLEREALLRVGPIEMSPPNQPDGRDLPCEVRLVRLPMSHRQLVRGSVTDISDRKRRVKANEMVLRRLLDLQEKERRMVAYDIHDGFVQDVFGAHFHVQSLCDVEAVEPVVDKLRQIGSALKRAIAEGRRLISDLRPMILDEAGVIEAIEHLVADTDRHDGLAVAFQHDGVRSRKRYGAQMQEVPKCTTRLVAGSLQMLAEGCWSAAWDRPWLSISVLPRSSPGMTKRDCYSAR